MIKNLYNKLTATFLTKEFMVFLVIGVINTFNCSVLSYLYALVIPNVNVSFVIGYLTSLFIAYLLNSFAIFKAKLELKKMIKFMVSYIPNFIIQNVIVFVCYNKMGWNEFVAFVLAAIIGLPITFLLVKIFAFGKNKKI